MRGLTLPWRRMHILRHVEAALHVVRRTRATITPERSKTIEKLARWEKQLTYVQGAIHKIESKLRDALQKKLDTALDAEMLVTALFQPSTKNLFMEMEAHFCRSERPPIDCEALSGLSMLPDLARAMALVGDAALSLAILHHLWKEQRLEVGRLTVGRANLVSNEHLAHICDDWKLYENRIHFDPPTDSKSEIDHIKGTLVEAVYGAIYISHGLPEVQRLAARLIE